MSSNLP